MKTTIIVCVFLFFFYFSVSLVEASTIDNSFWNVAWYDIDNETHQFETIIGHEKWTNINISYDWGYESVYGGKKDYVGFIATTERYFHSCTYEFGIRKVEAKASVLLDGNYILQTITRSTPESVKIDVPEGYHSLQITWTAYCCQASIFFNLTESVQKYPPTIEIISPSGGQHVYGNISITGTARDSDGSVENIQIKIDNSSWINVMWTNVGGIYSWDYTWNTKEVKNGDHIIQARSYDGTNYSNVSVQTIFVKNEDETPGFTISLLIGAIALISYFYAIKR